MIFKDDDGMPVATVNKDERQDFEAAVVSEELVAEETFVRLYRLDLVAFTERSKRRLNDGHSTIRATMEDRSFWDMVHARDVQFSEGDQLRCRLRMSRTSQRLDACASTRSRAS